MSVTNYTLPFAAPVPGYVNFHNYGFLHQSATVNSLTQDTPEYGQRKLPSLAPSSPSRRQPLNPRKTKDNRDPYRNQHPPKTRHPAAAANQAANLRKNIQDYDDNFNYSDYDSDKSDENYDKNYSESERVEKSTQNTNNKVKRKFASGQGSQQQQSHQERNPGVWPPNHPPTYKQIANTYNSVPQPGAKTSLHAVIDFDDDFEDEYSYEDEEMEPLPPSMQKSPKPQVTPIEGPILIKNGSVPVVPLYSYPIVNNGTLVQIPILWTALSLAFGFEIHGEIIKGVPCIKRYHQLFCPTAGNTYPIERIERFIDDNKALMKRMYGEFQMSTEYGPSSREIFRGRRNAKREANKEDRDADPNISPQTDSLLGKHRSTRQSFKNRQSDTGRVDACESKMEIVTPYWASNSAGKIRAIVNTQHFEQAIHQEVCSKVQTKRCVGDCGCEQKYKWHRLLAYDPDNDCKGIFMDWFLFPSCCVCRCSQIFGN